MSAVCYNNALQAKTMNIDRRIIPIAVFVCVGFFCASLLFRFLTNRASVKTAEVAVPSSGEKIAVSPAPPAPVLPPPQPESKPKIAAATAALQPEKASLTQQAVAAVKQRFVVEEGLQEATFPPLRVNGIFSSKEGSLALINDIVVKEGDVILGVKVVRILANAVELEMKGQTKTVRIK